MLEETNQLFFYTTIQGKCPFREWLLSIRDKKTVGIIDSRLTRVAKGLMGDCKHISSSSGLQELRIDYGPGYRIYLCQVKSKTIVILSGGNKKSQGKDIEKSKIYLEDFKKRYEKS